MRDAANIIFQADGSKLPVSPDETGKTATQDVPIAPEIANIGGRI